MSKLLNARLRRIVIKASQTFRQKVDAYTTTTEHVEWRLTLERAG